MTVTGQIETVSTILTATRTRRVTIFAEGAEDGQVVPEFVCPATTISQSGDSAFLELGDNCRLTVLVANAGEEAPTPVSERALAFDPMMEASPAIIPRQEVVCTGTLEGTTTVTSFSWTTTTSTLVRPPSPLPEFSCPVIVVTNAVGDELTLGDDCSLDFTPAEETPTDAREDVTSVIETATAAWPSSSMALDGSQTTSTTTASVSTQSTNAGSKSRVKFSWCLLISLMLW